MKFRLLLFSILFLFPFILESAPLVSESTEPQLIPFVAKDIEFQATILPAAYPLTEEEKEYKIVFDEFYKPDAIKAIIGDKRVEELGGYANAKEIFINDVWKRERKILGRPGVRHIRLETSDKKFVGYFSMEDWDVYTTEKPDGILDHSIYIRQLYILPKFQRQGIGRAAIFVVMMSLTPDAENIYVTTRAMNLLAQDFYEGLGFVRRKMLNEKDAIAHGISVGEYVSYEWHRGS